MHDNADAPLSIEALSEMLLQAAVSDDTQSEKHPISMTSFT